MAKQGKKDYKHNAEGFSDPTAYAAYKSLDREERRFRKLLKTIFSLCELAGFEVVGRIALRDRKSGKTWE